MEKIKAFLKRVLYAVGANLLSLVVSFLTTLLIPKFLGAQIEQYGYFQIYIFYSTYIGFFHFGLCDGVYLRDAGKSYGDLNKPLYSSQFWILSAVETIIAVVLILIGYFTSSNVDYRFIWIMTAISIVAMLPRTMLQYYLQTTNRIKEYSSITTTEKLLYALFIVAVMVISYRDYRLFIVTDVIAKVTALAVSIWWCRDIVFTKPCDLKIGLRECGINVSVGIKLLFANIASFLITGIVKLGIQQKWNVVTYGKISFTLNISNFLLVFINAIALVLYPTLRRADNNVLSGIYIKLRDVLTIPLMGALVLYYPVEQILSSWLPQYAESMRYMAILFPFCIFAAKMTMLIQTYMNVYRFEKQMLKVNAVGVLLACITTVISVFIMESLTAAMVSIVINQIFRCIYAELTLAKTLKLQVVRRIIFEVVLSVIFILANWFIGSWIGVLIYLIAYAAYCVLERQRIIGLFSYAKELLHH